MTDTGLAAMFDSQWVAQRIINLLASRYSQLVEILRRFGMNSIQELVGRTNYFIHLDYEKK